MVEKKVRHSEESEVVSVALTHLYRDMSRAFSQHAGMSHSRFLLLHELMHDGELSQSELQRRLGMEGALLTRFAQQMEVSGVISRRSDPADNRFTLIALTPKGHRLLKSMKTLRESSEELLADGLSKEERRELVRLLKKVQENISRWQK